MDSSVLYCENRAGYMPFLGELRKQTLKSFFFFCLLWFRTLVEKDCAAHKRTEINKQGTDEGKELRNQQRRKKTEYGNKTKQNTTPKQNYIKKARKISIKTNGKVENKEQPLQ